MAYEIIPPHHWVCSISSPQNNPSTTRGPFFIAQVAFGWLEVASDKGTLFGYFEVAAMTGQPRNGETRMAWQLEKVNALFLG